MEKGSRGQRTRKRGMGQRIKRKQQDTTGQGGAGELRDPGLDQEQSGRPLAEILQAWQAGRGVDESRGKGRRNQEDGKK